MSFWETNFVLTQSCVVMCNNYSISFTGVTFFKNCTSESCFNAACFLLLLNELFAYFYSVTFGYLVLTANLLLLSICQCVVCLFMFCFVEASSYHMTAYDQLNFANSNVSIPFTSQTQPSHHVAEKSAE